MMRDTANAAPAFHAETSGRYIPEVDALRGLAIAMVVGYHYMPGRMPGGFVGVDVFFVISGFLITGILLASLESHRFSFGQFYARRIRRLFPALLVVLLSVLAAGYLTLMSDEYAQIGKHVLAGSLFSSNFVLWTESGYFDNSALTKPLIHLWSLGIEEQFYLIFPLVLWFAWRRGAEALHRTIGLIGVSSFGLNLLLAGSAPDSSFYLPFTRAWELMLGAWLATRTRSWGVEPSARVAAMPAAVLAVVGMSMILLSSVLLSRRSAYPGWRALLPTLGTCAVIGSVYLSRRSFRLLRVRPLIFIGLISYPLYLWHWALISFVHIMVGEVIRKDVKILLLGIAIMLSWLTFRFVEIPIRRQVHAGRSVKAAVAGMAAVGLAGLFVFQGDGLPSRAAANPRVVHPGDVGAAAFYQFIRDHAVPCGPEDRRDDARCAQTSASSRPDLAILGDSHAEQLFIGLSQALKNRNVVYYEKLGVPLIDNPSFRGMFEKVLADSHIRTVVLTAFWGLHGSIPVARLSMTIRTLIESGKRVYLLDDVPVYPFGAEGCKYKRPYVSTKCDEARASHVQRRQAADAELARVVRENPGLVFVPTTDYFCTGAVCSMLDGERLLYRDSNHLNVDGSSFLAQRLLAQFPLLRE